MSNKLEFERGFLGMVIETKRLKIIVLTQEKAKLFISGRENRGDFQKHSL